MPTPGEHKTVQARILEYAEAIGWPLVSREEAEQRRGFDPDVPPADRARNRSLFFDDLLDAKLREFNPRYAEAEGALLGQFRHLHTDIYGNRDFVEHLRNRGKFFDHEEKRERDLMLIDYDDPARNVYEVTDEWAFHNGHYGTREDVVFLINGIPVLVIECKNANKDEAIALGVDQIRRYHRETPELFVSQQLFTATDAIGFSYGVCWNTVRRNIFNWKILEPQIAQMGADEENPEKNLRKSALSAVKEIPGRLEQKVTTFCSIPNILSFLKDYIVFAEKDEELNKFILRQHQTGAVEATFLGFTGTPVDKTVHGKGTFKTFGCEDDQGYLHKYFIADSIEDGTTLPLYYQLAPNVEHLRNRGGFFDHRADVHCRLSKRTHDLLRTTSHEQHLDRG